MKTGMPIEELRRVIAALEPLMDHFAGSFVELEDEARKLVRRLERTFQSDISDVEALLLAALVERLKEDLRHRELGLETLLGILRKVKGKP